MGLVILVILASLGIGITGAAPISLNKKGRESDTDPKIELVEEREESEKEYDEIS